MNLTTLIDLEETFKSQSRGVSCSVGAKVPQGRHGLHNEDLYVFLIVFNIQNLAFQRFIQDFMFKPLRDIRLVLINHSSKRDGLICSMKHRGRLKIDVSKTSCKLGNLHSRDQMISTDLFSNEARKGCKVQGNTHKPQSKD